MRSKPIVPNGSLPKPGGAGGAGAGNGDGGRGWGVVGPSKRPRYGQAGCAFLHSKSRFHTTNDEKVAELSTSGEWRTFRGDEIGILLGQWQWRQHCAAVATRRQAGGASDEHTVTMLASTVSSSMLGAVAKAGFFVFEETLTGFKWMGNRASG